MQIRKKNVELAIKKEELGILFDLSDNSKRDFIINFLLKADVTYYMKYLINQI